MISLGMFRSSFLSFVTSISWKRLYSENEGNIIDFPYVKRPKWYAIFDIVGTSNGRPMGGVFPARYTLEMIFSVFPFMETSFCLKERH